MLPAGLGAGSVDPDVDIDASKAGFPWLEPIPDTEKDIGMTDMTRAGTA